MHLINVYSLELPVNRGRSLATSFESHVLRLAHLQHVEALIPGVPLAWCFYCIHIGTREREAILVVAALLGTIFTITLLQINQKGLRHSRSYHPVFPKALLPFCVHVPLGAYYV